MKSRLRQRRATRVARTFEFRVLSLGGWRSDFGVSSSEVAPRQISGACLALAAVSSGGTRCSTCSAPATQSAFGGVAGGARRDAARASAGGEQTQKGGGRCQSLAAAPRQIGSRRHPRSGCSPQRVTRRGGGGGRGGKTRDGVCLLARSLDPRPSAARPPSVAPPRASPRASPSDAPGPS